LDAASRAAISARITVVMMRFLLGLLAVTACGDSTPVCAPFDAAKEPMSDPALICAVDCTSASADSDVIVHVTPTAAHATTFVAEVKQTRPSAVDDTFLAVRASWSGHFYNLGDTTTLAPLMFHLLVGRTPGEGNVEIYTDVNTMSGGPVTVSGLNCQPRGY
jgi:hypothetical protein